MQLHVVRSQRSQLPQSESAVQPVHSPPPPEEPLPPLSAVKLPSLPAAFFIRPAAMEQDPVASPANVDPSANDHVMLLPLMDHVPVVAPTPSPARILAVLSASTSIVSSPGVRPDHSNCTFHEPSGAQSAADEEAVPASATPPPPLLAFVPPLQPTACTASAAATQREETYLPALDITLFMRGTRATCGPGVTG